MSYDLSVGVKAEGCGAYVDVRSPEYDSPTYNLRDMFVACMDWDYEQRVVYSAADALPKIERGISELRGHPEKYEKYAPENGWGTLEDALEALESWRECIYETLADWDLPISSAYVRW